MRVKTLRVAHVLRTHYYRFPVDLASVTKGIGSHAMRTAIRPPTDADLIFVLPRRELARFEALAVANRQSYVLQEVKGVLLDTFPSTDIKGDGPAVVVDFASLKVEVVPAFKEGVNYFVPSTQDGGRWKLEMPNAEIVQLAAADARAKGKVRDLIRLMKAWRRYREVPIRSVPLRLAAIEFLRSWPLATTGDYRHYGLLVQDFLEYLIPFRGGTAMMPGTGELLNIGDDWSPEASRALKLAQRAVFFSRSAPAVTPPYWSDIFGPEFAASP